LLAIASAFVGGYTNYAISAVVNRQHHMPTWYEVRPQYVSMRLKPSCDGIARRVALTHAIGLTVASSSVSGAFASGGATSGRTTSIPRAKLRYFGRVTAAVAAFESLKATADVGSVSKSTFFKEDAGYSEFKTAGYLLAVAFKIDGKIPPERIEQARRHKALMASLDKLQSASKDKVGDAYAAAAVSLNAFLEGVELPPLGDDRYRA